jgi:hypothetical protein
LVDENGWIAAMQVGQFGTGAWLPDPMNPIVDAWHRVWTPASYEPRITLFELTGATNPGAAMFVQDGTDPTTGHPILYFGYVPRVFGSIQIPVVPSPATSALLLGAGLFASRRRRKNPERALRMKPLLCIAAPLALASAATAQTGHITHTLRWIEVDPATNTPVPNPNGILEPGEAARITLDISFTPQVGSPHAYGSPPTNIGVLRGIRGDIFDLIGSGGTHGTWIDRAPHPIFNVHENGIQINQSLAFITIGQTGTGAWLPDPMNPIAAAWQGVWIPNSHTPRMTSFQTLGPSRALIYRSRLSKHTPPRSIRSSSVLSFVI